MPRPNRRDHESPGLQPWHWFVLAAAVPIAHCANRLNLDLWHDEIYTIDSFVRHGPGFIISDYHLPNNHVLFSLLEWPFYCLSDSTFVLRLPSFVCAVGTLLVVFGLGRRLGGLPCAVLSTALLGLNQMFLNFAIQVRGYSLSMFLAACLASCSLAGGVITWRRMTAVVLLAGAFLYVLPTNVLFFVPLAAVAAGSAVARRTGVKPVVYEALAWAAAAGLALVCYLKILSQIRATAQTSSPSSWSYLPAIVGNFLAPATHDFVWFAPLLLLGLAAWAWPRRAGDQRQWTVPALCGTVIGGAFLLTGMLRISPFERVYCPLLVFLALGGGWLLAELTEAVRRRWAGSATAEAAAAVALLAVSLAIWPQLWTYPQRLEARRTEFNAEHSWPEGDGWPIADGYYCYYAANYRPSAVVSYLLDQRIEQSAYRLCWTDADHLNLWYYFAKAGLPQGYRPSSGGDRPRTFAVAPEPFPWKRLAKECRLTEDEISSFQPLGDFGYYRIGVVK
jgi:hypothetical protein